MATEPQHVTATTAAQASAVTSYDGRPPHHGQPLQEMMAVRAPQYGSGAQEDNPPRYNQVMGVEPPLYSEAVSSSPPLAVLHTPDTRLTPDRLCGSIFRALGQCNLVLATVLCLAVFVIVSLALESPYGQLPPRQKPPKQPKPVRASSFVFVRDNQTHMVRAEMRGCGTDIMPIEITDFFWSPIAVHFGESAMVDLSASVSEDINGPIKVDVKVVKHVAFLWLPVPCVKGFGSCEYNDVCTLVPRIPPEQNCPQLLPHASLPCRCPVTQGKYYIDHDRVQLPDVSVIPSWLVKGRYSARITALTPATGRRLGCYTIDVTVD